VSAPKRIGPLVLRLLAWIAAGSAVLLAAYFVFVHKGEPPVPPWHKTVAVMNLENATGDTSQDRWRAVRNLLQIDLGESRFLRLVPQPRLLQDLYDFHAEDTGVYRQEVLDKIASRENVDYFLMGSFLVSGQRCRIDIQIKNAQRPETITSCSFNAAVFEEIQDRCDDISQWAKQQFGFSESDLKTDFDKELKKYTTPSSEALLHFLHGHDFFKKGDYQQSSECYQKAVAVDKNFALAYARLAMNYTYEDRFEEAKTYILKAMSLRKNLSRRERLLIEGDYFNFYESDYPRAIERYEILLSSYPDDEFALEHQGAIYRNTEEWDKAQKCFERLHLINPDRITVRNLSFIAEAMGQYEKAARILQDNKEVFTTPEQFYYDLTLCFLYEGRTDQALLELKKGLFLDSARPAYIRLLGHINTIMGNYGDAEASYRQLLEEFREDSDKTDGHFWLGNLFLLQGQYKNCSREIEEGLKLARESSFSYEESTFLLFKSYFYLLQEDFAEAYETALKARQKAIEVHIREDEIEALHLKGLSEVGLGKLTEARRTVLTMEQIIRKIGFPKLLGSCHHLEGMIAGARKSWDEAVRDFLKAVETLPQQHLEYDKQALYLEALASAQFQRGDLDSARERYEKVISLTSGYLTAGDTYARSLYQLGRIFQDRNEPGKAKDYYQRYLNVLRTADPGLPNAEDARKRLAFIF
jgi:tetratricopeptide (TPR) repeat protein